MTTPTPPTPEQIAATIGNAANALPAILKQLARSAIMMNRLANSYDLIAAGFVASGIDIGPADLSILFQRREVQQLARLVVQAGILDMADPALVGVYLG